MHMRFKEQEIPSDLEHSYIPHSSLSLSPLSKGAGYLHKIMLFLIFLLFNGFNFFQVYEHMMFIFVSPDFAQQLVMDVCEMSVNLLNTYQIK